MKIHLAWIRVTAAAAIFAGAGAQHAAAQYVPYRPLPQQPAAPVQPVAAPTPRVASQPPYWQQAARQASATRYQAPATAQYQQTTAPYVPTASSAPTPAYTPVAPYAPTAPYAPVAAQYPTAGYPAAGYPTYPYVAQQPVESTQAPVPPAEDRLPSPERNGAPMNGAHANGAANGPMHNGHMHNGHVHNGVNGVAHDCNCQNGYVNGYAAGSYYDAGCNSGYGIGDYFDDDCQESQWFGGMYFLFMERDNASSTKLTVEVDHTVAPDPYYPPGDRTVLSTINTDHDFREGVEVRFGTTFTIGDSCDTGCYDGCNSCGSCPTVYAWEVAWWGLDDDADDITYVDTITTPNSTRIYGMKNFVGLEYDRDGAGAGYGYTPVNDYYDYQLPIPAPPGVNPDGYIEVVAQRVRTNFKAQNLELNIIRFPVCDMACGGCNTCNAGCYGDACEPACMPSMFSMYGSCGVRYFRVDDDFMYANEFREWDDTSSTWDQAGYNGWSYDDDNELFYDVQVENHLIGPQLGWTMNYCYACKWNFFANSTFGVFNNHIEHVQQMWSGGGGPVRFAGTGEEFYVESDKDDISFLGELRLGGSYDINCHWRAVAAYRAVAIAGLANSSDQVPSDFTNAEYVQIVDSDSSVIVHGVQVGAECRY
jgi:hypothetical protein